MWKEQKKTRKNFSSVQTWKEGNLFPRKAVKMFCSSFFCVCKEEKKPLNSHWSDFLPKLCQNVVESEVFFFSLIDISQIPDAFLLSNYSRSPDHVSTPSCKTALRQTVSSLYLVETLMVFLSRMSLVKSLRPAHPERSVELSDIEIARNMCAPEKPRQTTWWETEFKVTPHWVTGRPCSPPRDTILPLDWSKCRTKSAHTTIYPLNKKSKRLFREPLILFPAKCLVEIIFWLDKKHTQTHDLKIPTLNGGILVNKIMLPASFKRLSITLGF